MKILNGSELAGFIKERQVKQVRSLTQSQNIVPKLAIIKTVPDPVIEMYVNLKKKYGSDIGAEVEVYDVAQSEVMELISQLNEDQNIHGIIVQLPIGDDSELDSILNAVSRQKDVDGLAENTNFTPATPMAITWLVDGYNLDMRGKKIALIGRGRLVGAPLEKIYDDLGYDLAVYQKGVDGLKEELLQADVIISATGSAGLIKSDMIAQGAVAIDAGVASEGWKTRGDFDADVYDREDLSITPQKGGVGPLTVSALFENLIRSAQNTS